MLPLFRNVYWIAHEDLALNKMESLNNRVDLHNVESVEAYRNRTSCTEILQYIASTMREELIQELKNSFCFSISFDCSQDVSTKEQLILTVKYLNYHYQVQEKFCSLITLSLKDSQAIFNKIWELLESESLVSKLVGISTDGEPKIASKKNGVVGKFLNKLPHIIHIHCVCHQLVLGAREVFKKKDKRYVHPIAEVLNRLNALVYKVSSFFCASSKRNIVLMSAEEEALEEMNNYQLLRPFDVRWLSNFVAIERLLDLYPAVVKALKILEPSEKTLLTSVMITELTKPWNLFVYLCRYTIASPFSFKTVSKKGYNRRRSKDILFLLCCCFKKFHGEKVRITNYAILEIMSEERTRAIFI